MGYEKTRMNDVSDLPDPSTDARRFLIKVREHMAPTLHRSTVPILGQQHGSSGPTVVGGTGILFAVDDAFFIVSAAHVLTMKRDHRIPLCVPVGDGLAGDVEGDLVTHPNSGKVDVALLRLPDSRARELKDLGAEFLRPAQTRQVSPSRLPAGGYVVYGYPAEGSRGIRGENWSQCPTTLPPFLTVIAAKTSRTTMNGSTHCSHLGVTSASTNRLVLLRLPVILEE